MYSYILEFPRKAWSKKVTMQIYFILLLQVFNSCFILNYLNYKWKWKYPIG